MRMRIQSLNVHQRLAGRVHLEKFSNPGFRRLIERHAHHFPECHIVVRGHAILVAGGQRVELPSGSLVWLPPRVEHLTLETTNSLQRWILAMRVSSVRRILGDRESQPFLKMRTGFRVGRISRSKLSALERLLVEVSSEQSPRLEVINAGLGYLLANVTEALRVSSARTPEPTALNPTVARALSLMDGDGLCLTRDELAGQCGTSSTHLSRLFVRELGQSLREIRNRRRLARFQQLVRDSRCESLTDAALEAGFGSYSQFHRVFRNTFGVSPSEWQTVDSATLLESTNDPD